MSGLSSMSTIGGQWPFSYCHDIGQSALGILRSLKSAFIPTFYSPRSAAASGISWWTTANRYQCTEKFGWIIQTRFHFGNHLSRYVGVSILVKNNVGWLSLIARASGLVLLVGVGSYFAYRFCLKLFGCRDFASLLHYLCNGSRVKNAADAEQGSNQYQRCKKCQAIKGDQFSNVCSNCGGIILDAGDTKSKRHRRRLYSEANDNARYESSSSTSESQSSDQLADGEENPTEITDLGSECSGSQASGPRAARVDGQKNSELGRAQMSTAQEAQKKRWRNSVGKRTNALDDPNGAYGSGDSGDSDEGSITGFSKSRSPPPIRRYQANKAGKGTMSQSMPVPCPDKTPSVKSLSVQSVPSSQQFIWDHICTPGDEAAPLNDELLTYFADVPTGELVQRFLDGLFLSSDQNRMVSPGPSEAASEFGFAADRQIGDGTAEHFERLQCDLSELRTDVDEFDAELTTYLQERNDCLTSDNRLFYRSVIVDDHDDASAGLDAEDFETPSPSAPPSPAKRTECESNGAAKISPCHRLSNKRHRKSHESSNGSSTNTENNNANDIAKNKRRRRCSDRSASKSRQQERRDSPDRRRTPTVYSCNEKSALSLDAGYVSSYHTQISSVDSGPCSPSSVTSTNEDGDELKRNQLNQGIERPTDLTLPSVVYSVDSNEQSTCDVAIVQPVSDESGKPPSSFVDSPFPSSSSCGVTPEESWRQRPSSVVSLEWEDEIFGAADGPSPSESSRSRSGNGRLKAVDLIEFLRLYYNVDTLDAVPKMYQIGRKLTKRGYRRVLLYNDIHRSCHEEPATSKCHLDNLITASLIGAAHFRWPIFKCQSFRIVPEAVDVSMKRCSFFAERCSTYFGSTTPEGTRAYILRCMQKLWKLHESVQQDELQAKKQRASPKSSWALIDASVNELVDGVKVLMALRSLETYEEILFTRRTTFAFYTDLFRIHTPASYAEQKLFRSSSSSPVSVDDLDIALLADTLSVRIEMFRPNSSHPESVAVYPEMEHNANLSRPRLPLLEPNNDVGLYLPLI